MQHTARRETDGQGGAQGPSQAGHEPGQSAAGGAGRQLALPFAHRPRFERADFLEAGSNRHALAWLARRGHPNWPQRRLALCGEAGSGKTHLLHVWADEHDALLLPGTALRDLGRLARGPGRRRAIAVDDADTATDEAALLHLLNAAQESGLPVLLTARLSPARWPVALPDLRSRLRATHSVTLGFPDSDLLRVLLIRLLLDRQLAVAPVVIDWLLARLPRTAAAMREAARLLDEAALASGGGVTRVLASRALGRLLDGPAEAGDDALPQPLRLAV